MFSTDIFQITTNREIHTHNTRRAPRLHLPLASTSMRQKTIAIFGAEVWNMIPMNIQQQTFAGFCRSLKSFVTTLNFHLSRL